MTTLRNGFLKALAWLSQGSRMAFPGALARPSQGSRKALTQGPRKAFPGLSQGFSKVELARRQFKGTKK